VLVSADIALVVMIELTVCGDSPDAMLVASAEKRRRYLPLHAAIEAHGSHCVLIVLPIGQLGSVPRTALQQLGRFFQRSKSTTSNALQAVSRCVHRKSLGILKMAVAQLARSTGNRNPFVADTGSAIPVPRPHSSTKTSRQ
jgi:hypothetical protein